MPTARRPVRRPRRPARSLPRVLLIGLVGAGAVALLVGLGVTALNEPTAVPTVSANLVVLSRGELLGSRLVAVGACLLALVVGVGLGGGRRRGTARRGAVRRRRAT